jgi:FtsP/CotA-like multicopper oxidase with cupredoxin domain
MKLTNHNQKERRPPSSFGQTDRLNQTNLFAQRASKRRRLSFSGLLVLGLGAMAFLSGCTVTVREPGVVVTPPTVAVETPPVVLEEGVGVVVPVGVDFVLFGGRYAWFDPGLGRWYYRPVDWRPPVGYRAREVHGMGELEAIHRSNMRREPGRRPDARREEPKKMQKKEEPKKTQRKEEKRKDEK